MKKIVLLVTVLTGLLAANPWVNAAEKEKEKAKPYPLKVCVVSDEKLDSMGEPYVFTHEGREVKLCCKSCLKDFKKDTAKFVKKMEEAEKSKK